MKDSVHYPYSLRRQILRTAKTLFDLYGYERTSLVQVGEQLKVTEQVVLLFFRSKDDLLEAVWSEL